MQRFERGFGGAFQRTPREGSSLGFSSEGVSTTCTCSSPAILRAASLRSNLNSAVDERPLAAAPAHTAESLGLVET